MERDAVARLRLRPPAIVEPFGLDAAEFADLPPKGEFRARHPQVGDRKLVVFLGRLDYGKGLELLIPAFAEITRDDAALVIVGPDSHSGYRQTVERMIAEHELVGRVVLTGMLTGREKLAALVDAHVMAQPSFHENFGLAVVEGLACGTPVIVSDQVYLWPKIKEAGVGGVTRLTADDVAAALNAWLDDPALRDRAATGAREFALREFAWDRIAQNWVGHYERVAESSA
jgi:glycosyltransferase involved in cell wall biosynthesis